MYTPDGSGGFDYEGGIELDFPAMSQGQVAGVSVKFDFSVGPGPWDSRRLNYGTTAEDPRMRCPASSGAQPVEVECTCSDGLECRSWTLRASTACLSITKNAEPLVETVEAPWELTLTAQGDTCVP